MAQENTKSIYELALHESVEIARNGTLESSFSQTVTRVPGGWIYRTSKASRAGSAESSVFVPFHKEFEPKKPAKVRTTMVTPQ